MTDKLMWQQLTVVNEHYQAPKILSQLYLLLFPCQITWCLSLTCLPSHLYGVFVTEKISLSLLPYQFVAFLRNKYYLSQQF
jgi:hypothetical protein